MKEAKSRTLTRTVVLWVVILLFLAPIVWLLTTSFKTRVDAFAIPPKWIFTPTLQNYKTVITTGDFMKSYRNSVIIAFSSTGICFLLGVPMAYAMARFRPKSTSRVMMWILSTKMAPPIMVAVPFYLILLNMNMLNKHISLIFVYLLFNMSFTVWMMYDYIGGVPLEIEESARIDGLTRLKAFFRVELPLCKGGLFATAILCIINAWNEFMFALMLSGNNTKTAPVAITTFISFEGIKWGEIAAAGMLIATPIIILAIIVQDSLISGLTMGAVKG